MEPNCVIVIPFARIFSIYKKIIEAVKNFRPMRKKDFKRINMWVDLTLYNKIKQNADNSYLRVSTYLRQLIQQAINNNIIKN